MQKNVNAIFSSASEEWSTPQDFFDKLNEEFHFTLDVCATKENAKCKEYFTKEDNGLLKAWWGVVWCNPPYGRSAIPKWCRKAYTESEHCTVVMLVPSRTDTQWFHDLVYGKAEIRFVKGRIKFGGSKNNAPFPSMIVVYRKRGNND